MPPCCRCWLWTLVDAHGRERRRDHRVPCSRWFRGCFKPTIVNSNFSAVNAFGRKRRWMISCRPACMWVIGSPLGFHIRRKSNFDFYSKAVQTKGAACRWSVASRWSSGISGGDNAKIQLHEGRGVTYSALDVCARTPASAPEQPCLPRTCLVSYQLARWSKKAVDRTGVADESRRR